MNFLEIYSDYEISNVFAPFDMNGLLIESKNRITPVL